MFDTFHIVFLYFAHHLSIYTYKIRQGFAHSVSVTSMNGNILLAMGTDDSSISLYHVADTKTVFFTKLTGKLLLLELILSSG